MMQNKSAAMNLSVLLRLTLGILCAHTASCSPLAPQPNRSKFFMLSPISEEAESRTPTPFDQQFSIGVGPIDFPDYLKRREVVTRTAANRIDVSEANRWAGPLDKNFARVLAENLGILLNTQRLESYPWNLQSPVDYQVIVDIERFDVSSDHQARLKARWAIRKGIDGKVLYATETSSSVLVGSEEDGPSAALSSNLASLSRDIAFQLTVFSRQRVRPISNPEVSMATICFDTTLRTVAGDDAVELCGT
jgi:uncharacterized lipoprotein YmbA